MDLKTSPGDSPDDRVPVAEICKIAGVKPTYYYWLVREGRAPKSKLGVPLAEAAAWLKARPDVRRATKAAAAQRLRALLSPETLADLEEGGR